MEEKITKRQSSVPKKISTSIITRIAVLVALISVCAQIYFPLPFTPIAITLQTLAIMICAVVLRPVPAISAVAAYVLAGLCGIPVFSGFKSWAALASPTGGFIVGFLPAIVFMAFAVHFLLATKAKSRVTLYLWFMFILLVFTLIVHACGLVWFMIVMKYPFPKSVMICTVPFLPGDALKALVVILGYPRLIKLRTINSGTRVIHR